MRKYMLIMMILLALSACSSLKKTGSTNLKLAKYKPLKHFNKDTLLFVKSSIMERKEYYIGKEIDVLLKDLQIPVKQYTYSSEPTNRSITPGMRIYIYTFAERDNKKKNKIDPISIYIRFKEPLLKEEPYRLLLKNKTNWTPEVAAYYGKQIIGEIDMVKYNFK